MRIYVPLVLSLSVHSEDNTRLYSKFVARKYEPIQDTRFGKMTYFASCTAEICGSAGNSHPCVRHRKKKKKKERDGIFEKSTEVGGDVSVGSRRYRRSLAKKENPDCHKKD